MSDEIFRAQLIEVIKPPDMYLPNESWEGFAYWYDGVPEYCTSNFPLGADSGTAFVTHDGVEYAEDYVTAIVQELFGQVKTPDGWERVTAFSTSGETECLCSYDNPTDPDYCPICKCDGYIYIGDGWREVVFRQVRVTE